MVHNYYQIPGGEDTVVANEMQMLKKYGHHVVFYSRNNSELNEMSKFQKLFLPVNTIFNFRTYRDIKRIIKQEKIAQDSFHFAVFWLFFEKSPPFLAISTEICYT